MPDYSEFKIPILPDINDDPQPPNFGNNGRGPNGSYFTERYNALIDALNFDAPAFTALNVNTPAATVEVGQALYSNNAAVNMSYAASNASFIESAQFYAGGALLSATSFTPGQTYSYDLSSYTGTPNLYLQSADYTWEVRGTDTNGSAIGGNRTKAVSWRYRTYWGYSTNDNVTNHASLSGGGSSLTRPTQVTKPTSPSAYLYIFLPIGKTGLTDGWSAYNTFKVAGFNAVMAPVTVVTLTRLNVSVVYNRYRLFYPTAGAFTLDLT
jgi:hypothetical protein